VTRRARWLELVLLFGLLPLLGLTLQQHLQRWCLVLILRDAAFKRFRLFNSAKLGPALWRRRSAFALGLAASALLYTTIADAQWFHLPAQNTGHWLLLLLVYPIFSVLPQELIYRTFFFHRYKIIIPHKYHRAWLSALAFAWAHCIYGNWMAPALAVAGGLLFAFTYAESRSTLACVVEHSVWGLWLFSFGLGGYLDSGRL
jgi:uncharacterized protein